MGFKVLEKRGGDRRDKMKRITTPFDPHIKRIIDLIGLKLNGGSNLEDTIIISGAPRTGTTLPYGNFINFTKI